MKFFTKTALLSTIKNATNFVELSLNGESSIVISEFGGRPLGVFPKEGSYSLLWINPDIVNAIKTRNRLMGGDRYWISPERAFFYKNPDAFKDWFCPETLDPARYEILASSNKACTVSSEISVVNQFTKEAYSGEITRQFTFVKEPFRTGVNYCGIEFLDDCVFYKPDLKINGWTLANVISGGVDNPGTVLIPTKRNPKPLSYFRVIPKDRIRREENYVAFKIDVNDIYKLAVRPDDIDFNRHAKIGYVLKMPDSEEYGFLVKLSNDVPKTQKECFDVARDRPDAEIGVIQSFNAESPDKPRILKYGEIEAQLNLFETIDNTSEGKARHQLFGYIGSKDEILNVIEKYLGVKNPILF